MTHRGGHQPSPAQPGMVLPAGHIPAGHSRDKIAKAPSTLEPHRQGPGIQTLPFQAGQGSHSALMEDLDGDTPAAPFPEQVPKSPSPRKSSTCRRTGSRSRDGCPVSLCL